MTFDEYQKQAQKTRITCINPLMDQTVWVLGINGEAGELAEKWKKIVAYDKGEISEVRKNELIKEMGDVLWYLAAFAESLDVPLQKVADMNLEKTQSRHQRGITYGDGDDR